MQESLADYQCTITDLRCTMILYTSWENPYGTGLVTVCAMVPFNTLEVTDYSLPAPHPEIKKIMLVNCFASSVVDIGSNRKSWFNWWRKAANDWPLSSRELKCYVQPCASIALQLTITKNLLKTELQLQTFCVNTFTNKPHTPHRLSTVVCCWV